MQTTVVLGKNGEQRFEAPWSPSGPAGQNELIA